MLFPPRAMAGQQQRQCLAMNQHWHPVAHPAGWQSTPVVNIFKQCDVESKKNVELSGKVRLRMVRAAHHRL